MKLIFPIIALLSLHVSAQNKNINIQIDSLKKNGHKIQTLKFNYSNIACPCAQWAESKFNGGKRMDERVQTFFEPANDSIENLLKVDDFPFQVKVTGEYISEKGYPKNYKSKGNPEPAPVFRVYKVKIIKRG